MTTATGETRNIAATRTFLEKLASAGDERQAQTEQAVATLRTLNLDDATLAEAQGVIEDCGQVASKARHTLTAMNDKHRLMEEAVGATPQAADRDYYRH